MATPPEEVLAPPRSGEAYLSWRATTDLRAPFRIAPEFLRGTKRDADWDTDETPLIVFINAHSGGRVGPELASVLARALGRSQVFDLSQHRPDTVMARIWANLAQQEAAGNPRAALVRSRLRILACGGDGTVAWIMKVIRQLDLQPQPAVAIMPLGTGNDLSRSFRWGSEFVHGWIKGQGSVYSTLKRIADAPVADLDCWRLRLLLPSSSYKPAKTYAICEVQQQEQQEQEQGGLAAQHSQQQQPAVGGCAGEAGDVLMEGFFWNYFSVGADAQAAYSFHHLRDAHPQLAGSRLANQFWYSAFSCTSGWFCGAIPSVSNFTRVEVMRPGDASWSVLHVPASIKALVLVNLQSYAGGRNIWGSKPSKVAGKWADPGVADGLLEVVGFHSGYHALAVMTTGAKLAHGKRLAQVSGIRLALRDAVGRPDGEAGQVFMQLDGEPWLQQVPAGGGNSAACVVLEVVNWGTNKVLANSSKPEKHPEQHITKMLTDQQQAAYLTASQGSKTGAATATAAAAVTAKQQQEMQAVHIASQPAAGVLEMQELPAGGAAAGHNKQAAHAPSPAGAASGAAARAVATDGGAPCSTQQEYAGIVLDARRSLEHDAAGGTPSAASDASAAPSSSSSGVLAPLTPGAVAVIEAVGGSSSSGRAGSAQPGGSGSPHKLQPGKGAAAAAAAASPPRVSPAGFSFWGSGKPKAQASAAGEHAGGAASK